MGWIDTHAHLNDPNLLVQLDDVIARAKESGLEGVLCVAVDEATSNGSIGLAKHNDFLRASVGIHPNYAHQASPDAWHSIVNLSQTPTVVALGETGLDLYWDDCPFERQLDNFHNHWQLSRETGLPVIIHMRDCQEEMLCALRQEHQHGGLRGVMHSFTGSLDAALECIDLGLYISFAGMITFKKSVELREVAARLPADRLLVETDSPYLTPEPFRSKRPNEPSYVVRTAQAVAEAQNMSLQAFMNCSRDNTRRLFSRW
ncbi:MAG: TatD family hydrolase [Pirellula sp.]|jgi:TatD DNase family protein